MNYYKDKNKDENAINNQEESMMAKNLIIYYSRKGENYVNGRIVELKKGNTEICAEYI